MERNVEYFKKLKEENYEQFKVERDIYLKRVGGLLKMLCFVMFIMAIFITFLIIKSFDPNPANSINLKYVLFIVCCLLAGSFIGLFVLGRKQTFTTFKYLKEEKRNG